MENKVHYDAFISYRHSELDSFVAANIHKKLEKFVLPKSIKKSTNGKTKIERVFRDVDELTMSDNLSDPINEALANSDYLITICTPRYLESRWCMKEIETFLQTHDRSRILVVLAEGEPTESFPEILKYEDVMRVDNEGKQHVFREVREPLAADTRGENKKEILKAIDVAIVKLCAMIFGLKYDDLRQRAREQKLRKMALTFGAIGVAVLAFAIFASVMFIRISKKNQEISRQAQTINDQYAQIQDKYAGTMATVSESLLSVGRRMDAAYVARSVLPDKESEGYNSDALLALSQALGIYETQDKFFPDSVYDSESTIYDFLISCNGKYVAVIEYSCEVIIFDGATGERIVSFLSDEESINPVYAFCGEEGFVYLYDGTLRYYSFENKEEVIIAEADDAYCYATPNGGNTILIYDDYLSLINPGGDIVQTTDLQEESASYGLSLESISFDKDNAALAFSDYDNYFIYLLDCKTGNKIISFADETADFVELGLYGDKLYYVKSGYDSDTSEYTKCYCLDTNAGYTWWIKDMSNFLCSKVVAVNDYVMLCDYGSVAVLGAERGTQLNYYFCEDMLINAYADAEEYLYYIDQNGRIYAVDDSTISDLSITVFSNTPDAYLMDAEYNNGNLFYLFSSEDYLTKYTFGTSMHFDDLEVVDIGMNYEKYGAAENASDIIPELDGLNERLVENIFYSEDKSLVIAVLSGKTVRVYSAETKKQLASLYDVGSSFSSFIKVKEENIYLLNSYSYSYVLNDEFEIIGKLGGVVGFKDGCFVVEDVSKQTYVPYMNYEQIIEVADKYLGKYEPFEEIKAKYNIQ